MEGGSLFYEDLGVGEEPTSSVFTTSSSVKREKFQPGKMKMMKTFVLA